MSQAFATKGASDGGFGESENLVRVRVKAMQYLKSKKLLD